MGIPYNENEELMAMKEDLANRKFRVRMIGMLIVGGLIAAALATVFMVPAAGAMLATGGGAKLATAGLLGLGAGLTTLFTMKEVKRIEIDEKYIQSYMKGKNYWGEGYRQEVAEHGYSLGGPFPMGVPSRHQDREIE